MQNQFLLTRRVHLALWFAGLLLACAAGPASFAHAATAQLNAKVPAGKWKAVRLKNLPEGAKLAVRVVANGSLSVILVHEAELKRYPQAVGPVFQGTVERSLSFSVVIQDTGNHYVIFDNRKGTTERRVRILLKATAPESGNAPPGQNKGSKKRI